MTPNWLPSASITRISLARMRSFMRIKRLSIQPSKSPVQSYVCGIAGPPKRGNDLKIIACGIEPASGHKCLFRNESVIPKRSEESAPRLTMFRNCVEFRRADPSPALRDRDDTLVVPELQPGRRISHPQSGR